MEAQVRFLVEYLAHASVCLLVCIGNVGVLPNQVSLLDAQQAKGWDMEVCDRERVYSQGSQTRPES